MLCSNFKFDGFYMLLELRVEVRLLVSVVMLVLSGVPLVVIMLGYISGCAYCMLSYVILN